MTEVSVSIMATTCMILIDRNALYHWRRCLPSISQRVPAKPWRHVQLYPTPKVKSRQAAPLRQGEDAQAETVGIRRNELMMNT